MLKKFEVTNYKNFKDKIVVDFSKVGGYQFNLDCTNNSLLSKVIIYGRNASGKTNLGKAIFDIKRTLIESDDSEGGVFLNADSEKEYASFCYEFVFGDSELVYSYKRKNEKQLFDEKLCLNGEVIFYYDFVLNEFKIGDLSKIDAETVNVERFTQIINEYNRANHLPFLRWLMSNVAFKKDALLLQLDKYIRRMAKPSIGTALLLKSDMVYNRVLSNFFETLENLEELTTFEEFLNYMGIKCKLKLRVLPDGQRNLYFQYKNNLIPFNESASSGALALLELYRSILVGTEKSFLYLDEFDAYYHYEMSEKLVNFIKQRYPSCQVILTTHNTNLMSNRIMRPDSLFILSRDGRLTALCNATERELREGHNLEKMYISGEFDRYE